MFLRSPYGHARFRIEDLEAARAAPGVRGVFVASDFSNLGPLPCLASVPNSDKSKTPLKPYPVMATGEADHVGDIIAMVVADTTHQGRDAAELIGVSWDELPAAVDMEEAIRPGAPLVFAGAPGNVAYDAHLGDKQKTDAAFARASRTVRIKIVNPRVVANYMEPRAAVGEYDSHSGRLTLQRREPGRPCHSGRRRRRNSEDSADPSSRGDPGRRRRLRHQADGLSRISARSGCGAQTRAVGAAGRRIAASISLGTRKAATM